MKKKTWLSIDEVIRRDYKSFRQLVLAGTFFLSPIFGLMAAAPFLDRLLPVNALIFFWIFAVCYAAQVIFLIVLLQNGWSSFFFLFLAAATVIFGCGAAGCFFSLINAASSSDVAIGVLSWLLIAPLIWWWGARVYCSKGEIKEAVLRSKRIDLDNAQLSPYLIPSDLYEARWARNLSAFNAMLGGSAIGASVFTSYWLNSRSGGADSLGGAICSYGLVLASIFCLSAGYHEWRWIFRWEKSSGRRIYIKEIIRWKNLKQQSK